MGAKERTVRGQLTVVEPLAEPEVELVEDARVGDVVLSAKNLVKDFPVTKGVLQRKVGTVSAVADVSFDIRKGETLGLVGESGCGKTTIGRMLVGLDKPTSGSIHFGGKDLARSSGREYRRERRDIQYMFQDSYASLDPRMRAGSILREPLIVQGMGSRREQLAKVRDMLGKVGLPASWTERYPHEFSGGQRQRLGFARALMLNPQLIVADEPVSALDVSIQAQVLNMMRDLQHEFGLTYLFISHDLSVVRYLSNHIGGHVPRQAGRDRHGGRGVPASRAPVHQGPDRVGAHRRPGRRNEPRCTRASPASCRARSTRRPAAGSAPGARSRRRSARPRAGAAVRGQATWPPATSRCSRRGSPRRPSRCPGRFRMINGTYGR